MISRAVAATSDRRKDGPTSNKKPLTIRLSSRRLSPPFNELQSGHAELAGRITPSCGSKLHEPEEALREEALFLFNFTPQRHIEDDNDRQV